MVKRSIKLFGMQCYKIMVIWAILLLPVPVFAQSISQNNLKQLELLRFKAMIEEDTAFLQNVMSDDCIYIHSNGLEETKSEHISNIKTRFIDYQIMDSRELIFRVYEGFAIGNGVVMVTGTYDGQTFTIPLKYTDVYRHTPRGWKLVNWQSVKLVNYEPSGKND